MANKYINVATLTWLDRRQLWATTNRTSSLGINTVSVHPSTLGGQGSRPGVSHRHFSPSLSWFVSATFAILGLALASALALFAIRAALCLAFKRLTLVVDKTLAPRAKGQRRQTAYTYIDLQPLGLSVDFANLVYSLVGSFDVASSHMPICKKTPLIGHSSWEISPLSLPLNGWSSRLATPSNALPSFRGYLGEWRRLLDESLKSPAFYSPQGYIQTTRSRLTSTNPKAQTSARGSTSVTGTGPSASNNTSPYSLYLSTPWVF